MYCKSAYAIYAGWQVLQGFYRMETVCLAIIYCETNIIFSLLKMREAKKVYVLYAE